MGSNFQMPEFNFRLRRALNPFEGGISPTQSTPKRSPFSSVGDTFADNAGWGDEEEQDFGLPPFSRAMPDFSSLYDKTGPATQRYQSHLSEVPALKDFAPTKWRRLGAVLAGTSAALGGKDGYSKAREIVMDPYQTAYGDWEGRGAGLKESATLEESATAKKATLHQKILSDYMDSQDKGFDREVRWGTLQNQVEQTKIQQKRAEIEADYRAGLITNGEYANKIRALDSNRRYNVGMAGVGARDRATDVSRYGIEQNAYNTKKQRELQERLGATGPVAGGSQLDVDQMATDAAYRAMATEGKYDPEDFFFLDENKMPIGIKSQLPVEISNIYWAKKNAGLGLAGRR